MSKNRSGSKSFHVIPMMKGYVKGYYEKRNGKLVWISPYENSKDKKPGAEPSKVIDNNQTGGPKPPKFDAGTSKSPVKPMEVSKLEGRDNFDFVLEVVIDCIHKIWKFEPGEVVKLFPALRVAKGIIRELGYKDAGIEHFFEMPDAKQTKLGSKAARETAAMTKNLNRLSRRIIKGTLREKVQRMAETMEEAL